MPDTANSDPILAVIMRARQGRRQGPREQGRRLPWRPSAASLGQTSERPRLPGGRGVVGLGRGRAGVVGGRRHPEVAEDGAHDRRILDGGNDAQPAATGTGQNIESEREHAVHQRRPGPGVGGDGGAVVGLELRDGLQGTPLKR